jgi:hypothetical protein
LAEEKQFAPHRLGPDGKPLQLWPLPKREDFASEDDFWDYLEAVSRYNSNLPPKPRPVPTAKVTGTTPAASVSEGPPRGGLSSDRGPRKMGIRLTPDDHALLVQLAAEHAITPSTMARILVAKGVRAAYHSDGDS